MDEKRFLNELCTYPYKFTRLVVVTAVHALDRNSRYLSHAVSRSCKSSIKLISQTNGRNGSCTEIHICTPEPIIVESLDYTPAGCKSEGFQLSFFVSLHHAVRLRISITELHLQLHVGEATLLSEAKNFLSFLHLLHIVNPDVSLLL